MPSLYLDSPGNDVTSRCFPSTGLDPQSLDLDPDDSHWSERTAGASSERLTWPPSGLFWVYGRIPIQDADQTSGYDSERGRSFGVSKQRPGCWPNFRYWCSRWSWIIKRNINRKMICKSATCTSATATKMYKCNFPPKNHIWKKKKEKEYSIKNPKQLMGIQLSCNFCHDEDETICHLFLG